MKYLRIIAVLGILLLSVSIGSLRSVQASAIEIISVASLDPWGNFSTSVYRGNPAGVTLIFNAPVDGGYQVQVTLVDRNNVPVGSAVKSLNLNGNTSQTLDLIVSSSAFVGVGKYSIVIFDSKFQNIASTDAPIYIGVLGDLNLDGKVTFQDLTNFVTGYVYYNEFQTVPLNFRIGDINGDGKIDFIDLTIFATAYISYWHL
jgi:hypothetical protein